jgi:hypothetical protein
MTILSKKQFFGGNMTTRITTPPAICKFAISAAICKRSTELVKQANEGKITHQEYLSQQFPADAISFIEAAIDEAAQHYEEQYKTALECIDEN